MRLQYNELSEVRLASRNEVQISKTKCIEICKPNYPIAKGYWKLSRHCGIINTKLLSKIKGLIYRV
jgi:hypothetical protein